MKTDSEEHDGQSEMAPALAGSKELLDKGRHLNPEVFSLHVEVLSSTNIWFKTSHHLPWQPL